MFECGFHTAGETNDFADTAWPGFSSRRSAEGCRSFAIVSRRRPQGLKSRFSSRPYVVSLRQREFGIRVAIGAQPADLRRLVARAALRLSAWGLGIGLVIANPLAFVAAFVPARRAARVDPVTVLRTD